MKIESKTWKILTAKNILLYNQCSPSISLISPIVLPFLITDVVFEHDIHYNWKIQGEILYIYKRMIVSKWLRHYNVKSLPNIHAMNTLKGLQFNFLLILWVFCHFRKSVDTRRSGGTPGSQGLFLVLLEIRGIVNKYGVKKYFYFLVMYLYYISTKYYNCGVIIIAQ